MSKLGAWDEHTHTTMYKINKQQGPTARHKDSTQYSVITRMGKGSEKGWIHIHV